MIFKMTEEKEFEQLAISECFYLPEIPVLYYKASAHTYGVSPTETFLASLASSEVWFMEPKMTVWQVFEHDLVECF
jgi:hypothetical protein